MLTGALVELSERTQRAVQDYTALNTLASAFEALAEARTNHEPPPEFASELLTTLMGLPAGEEGPRIRYNCPLGKRLSALGLMTRKFRDKAGRVKQ